MMNRVAPIGTGAFRLVGSIPEVAKPTPSPKKAAKKVKKKPSTKKAKPQKAKKPSAKKPSKKTKPTKAKKK
jgi:hypothetical protein